MRAIIEGRPADAAREPSRVDDRPAPQAVRYGSRRPSRARFAIIPHVPVAGPPAGLPARDPLIPDYEPGNNHGQFANRHRT